MSAVPIIVTAQAVQTRSRSANNRGGRTARGRDRLSMKAVDATGDQHVFDAADYERERFVNTSAQRFGISWVSWVQGRGLLCCTPRPSGGVKKRTERAHRESFEQLFIWA